MDLAIVLIDQNLGSFSYSCILLSRESNLHFVIWLNSISKKKDDEISQFNYSVKFIPTSHI